MAKEARKLQRATSRQSADGKSKKKALKAPIAQKPAETPDPLGKEQLKSMGLRIGLPVLGLWVVGGLIAGFFQQSTVTFWVALGLPAAVTIAAAGLIIWALRQAKKAKGVASILSKVESAEDRKAALEELEGSVKKKDTAAIFAKAQLELQDDPQKALATLESINLDKVLAPVADEARAQRAMIHLMLGQASQARQLVDNIDLKRHQDAKTRAMMAAVIGEAWARTGQAKRAMETLEVFNPEDEEYEQLRPQLYRAMAFANAYTSNTKGMRRALRKLAQLDARLLGAFVVKKTHPLLQKEAKKLLEQSGQMPRKMVVQRRA